MEETYTQQATAAPTAEAETTDALAAVHKLKLKPPTYDGNYSTFEEWKYRITADMGIQDPTYPQLMERAERATAVLVEAGLRTAVGTTQEAESWIQLSTNLKYILMSITSGSASTAVRQHQQEIGLEVYRQLCVRFSTPLGKRSIGYLTKLLKPTCDNNNFEESFSNWEFELQRYEAANTTRLPDPVKIAALMNETKRTTTTTLTSQCRSITNICANQSNNHGVLQDYHGTHKTTPTLISCQQQPWWRYSTNGRRSSIQRSKRKRQRKAQRKKQRKGKRIQQQRKRLRLRKRLRTEQQRKVKRKSTMAARTTEQRIQGQRKEQRKRKEPDARLLHFWPTWPSCKRL